MGKVILFYKYITIRYPKQIQKWQEKLCRDLGLAGRVLIATEGINATLGGSDHMIERYKQLMNEHELFGGIDFKESAGGSECFVRLSTKVKDEIVRLGKSTTEINAVDGGTHVTSERVHALLQANDKDLVVLDGRNNYESAIGKFEGAITPNIKTFRQFPEYIDQNLEQFKDKTVLMYCTGGIRCERASAYVKLKGVAKDVLQLEGGICRYVEKYPNGFFKGKNYIFDSRISVPVNDEILGTCFVCAVACDNYTNCLNAQCNRHCIVCVDCTKKLSNCCSAECQSLVALARVAKRKPLHVVSI
jgi:predicted sulfurtransferase